MKKEEIEDKQANQQKDTSTKDKETTSEATTEEKSADENTESQDEADTEGEEQTKASEEANKELELTQELASFKDKYLRLYSDFDNFRKRTSKEKLDLIKTASEDIIVSLLGVLDDFERANKSFEEAKAKNAELESPLKEGFDLIHQKILKTLEQKGLKAMDSIGNDFDTELHEAITQIPAPEEKMKGKVIDVIEKGYFLNEKVIRFAKVVIGA